MIDQYTSICMQICYLEGKLDQLLDESRPKKRTKVIQVAAWITAIGGAVAGPPTGGLTVLFCAMGFLMLGVDRSLRKAAERGHERSKFILRLNIDSLEYQLTQIAPPNALNQPPQAQIPAAQAPAQRAIPAQAPLAANPAAQAPGSP